MASARSSNVASVASDDLANLKAQRKALDAQIEAAKLASKASKLERVIAQQAAHLVDVIGKRLTARVRARVAAGQDQETALAQVFAAYTESVRQALDTETPADDPEGELTCMFCGGPVGSDGECTNNCDASRDASEPEA